MLQMSVHSFPVQNRPLDSRAAPNNSTNNANQSKPTHAFKCSYCPKAFKRSEHCSRHELSHTKERPFPCQFCNRSYARRDLVKRHERTIHADLYNALVNPSDPKQQQGAGDINTSSGQDRDVIHLHTIPNQTGRDASSIRDLAVPDDETLANHNETPTVSRRATFSGDPNTIRYDPTIVTSRASSVSPFLLTANAAVLNNTTTKSPEKSHCTSTSPMFARIRGQSSPIHPLSPIASSQHFDFNLSDLLIPSPLGSLSHWESHVDLFEAEQGRNKRQRLSDDAPSLQPVQNDEVFPLPTPQTMSSDDAQNTLRSFDFMDVDMEIGGVSNEIFFHQITQQENQALNGRRNMDNPNHISDSYSFGLPNSTDGSPSGQFSDSTSDTGTERTDRIRMPMILKEKSENPPKLVVDDAAFQSVCADAYQRLDKSELQLPFKNRRELQHLLSGYLDCFHRHLPIIHLPSLLVSEVPSPLIFAMCCIGALYRLDRQKAQKLYLMSASMLETELAGHGYPSPVKSNYSLSTEEQEASHLVELRPLWFMQARTLLLLYAALGSNSGIMKSELDRLGVFTTDHRSRRSALLAKSRQYGEVQWQEWIQIESTKRLLCAGFICSSLLVIVYGLPPGLGITQDLEIEVLKEENLWNASTADEWRALRDSELSSPTKTIRDVMEDMLAGTTNDSSEYSPYYVSGFTALVITHAVNVYAWNLSQLTHLHISPFSDLSGVAPNTLLSNALTTLARCREVLQLARPEGIESLWNNPEGPLLLNCEAMLRVAYTRLFLNASMPDGIVLLLNSPEENVRLLTRFVAARQERSPLIIKAMANMCEAFSVPSKAGYLLVQKTAAISWSVEHAVAGWGCVLLLSKWIHCLEDQSSDTPLTHAEAEIISQVKVALEGMDIECSENDSLAAAIVKSWASLMTDVWVWGITTRMGRLLMDLAKVYESSSRKARGFGERSSATFAR